MKEIAWRLFAYIVSRRLLADYLIGRATETPYFHLPGYMNRWWLFNRYSEVGFPDKVPKRFPRLPSIRIHQILRPDNAAHPHDHPWNARTIILRRHYVERRGNVEHVRRVGHTAPVLFGEYHHISYVQSHGAWTMFICWDYMGDWGFLVNGKKVPWREYVAMYPERA